LHRKVFSTYNETMKVFSAKGKVAILIFLLGGVFALNLISQEVRSVMYNLLSPMQEAVWKGSGGMQDFAIGLFHAGNLRSENEKLRDENLQLVQELVQLRVIAKENAELRSVLDAGLREEFSLLLAPIVGKLIGEDTILVRLPEGKEVKEGTAVITAGRVAVGKIVQVAGRIARVQLLSHDQVKTDVEIQKNSAQGVSSEHILTGVAKGQGRGALFLDLVPRDEMLEPDSILVTSNLGDVFPSSFLVGQIENIQKDDAAPFQQATIRSFFDLQDTQAVFLMTPL